MPPYGCPPRRPAARMASCIGACTPGVQQGKVRPAAVQRPELPGQDLPVIRRKGGWSVYPGALGDVGGDAHPRPLQRLEDDGAPRHQAGCDPAPKSAPPPRASWNPPYRAKAV